MNMHVASAVAVDLIAITILAYAIYFRRHQRRDLLLAYVALNVGVLAVTAALTGSQAGIGLGLGLFGILSIIRLRSDQITQEEIAYYFVALALGLIGGLHPGGIWVVPTLAALLLAVMYLVDHPRLAGQVRRQQLTLDTAYLDEGRLTDALEQLLAARVRRLVVVEVDLVRDTTVVDVRYCRGGASPAVLPRSIRQVAS